ncbi:DUF4238 domain-containing protein [Pseudomonas monsensis]|uniref:DUF4238 domain-containing protein n=1 Tax=Pseudomonas monsensis TaxID=2745509 RepID=UPI002ABB9571|nr:DUF4238 domain-containing protein [Pseudomonas monsensis]MDZ3826565.1 DUF4238 domain-containing protein [Pseudomonas monsensis]
MTGLHRDNHYIPKLYLKNWASAGKVLTYRLLVPRDSYPLWQPRPLKAIAFHQHLYTYTLGGQLTDEFERWLDTHFESPAAAAIERVVQEQRLTPEDWQRLIRFALCQDVRTPARMRQFLERQLKILPELMDATLQRSVARLEHAVAHGLPIDSKPTSSVAAVLDDCPFRITTLPQPDGSGLLKAETVVGRRLWLWQVRKLLTETIQQIEPKGWTVLHAPPGMTWPTSDNPLIRVGVYADGGYTFNSGWKADNGDLLLPLSPKHLLHCTVGKRPALRGTVVDRELAQTIKTMIVQHADQFVFSSDPADIATLRPRVVDLQRFEAERAGWRDWGNQQEKVEVAFAAGV